jgi:hypothetical protein
LATLFSQRRLPAVPVHSAGFNPAHAECRGAFDLPLSYPTGIPRALTVRFL